MKFKTRRAGPEDQAAISVLLTTCGGTPKYRKRFGQFNVANLIECGYLALVVYDEETAGADALQTRGFVVLSDGPRGAAHLAEQWLEGLGAQYLPVGCDCSVANTAFVEFVLTEQGAVGRDVVENALCTAARWLPALEHFVLVLDSAEPVPAECAGFFQTLAARPNDDAASVPELAASAVHYCARDRLVPTLSVREACVEDSDDLLPIFEHQSEVLSANFGDFFLAEMIESQDQRNRAIVSVLEGRAVGLLAVSTDLDVRTLSRCFQLEPYEGLMREARAATCDDNLELEHALEPNVFSITLFCLDERHESRASDFFAAMFALFPSRDYCVLTAPTTMNSNVSLLDHFTPVPSRVGSTFSHALFLLHRDALVADRQLAVRRFDPVAHGPQAALLLGRASEEHDPRDDLDDVSSQCDAASATAASLAATATAVARSNATLASFAEECDVPLAENPNVAAFVAVLGTQVVAVVAVSRRDASAANLGWIKANYHLEDLVPLERHRARQQGILKRVVLHPVFSRHARFVLKEVMRLYDKTVLFHQQPATEPLPSIVLDELVPVRARWRPTPREGERLPVRSRRAEAAAVEKRATDETSEAGFSAASLGIATADGARLCERERADLVHVFSRRLASQRKTRAHARVVVVGRSTCALGLLEQLLFEPELQLSSVTLISPRGLREMESEDDPLSFRVRDEDSHERFQLEALGLGQRLRVVHARVVDLDRANRAVVLPDGSLVLYDVLALCNGLQESSANCLRSKHREPDLLQPSQALLARLGLGLELPESAKTTEAAKTGDSRPHARDARLAQLALEEEEELSLALSAVRAPRGFVSFAADDACELLVERLLSRSEKNPNSQVLVYGGTLDALACARGLLDAGVAPANITLVFPTEHLESLGDAVVDRVALSALEQSGVLLRPNLRLHALQHNALGELQQARFTQIASSQAAPPPPPQRRFSDADTAAAHPQKRRSSELNFDPPAPTGEEVLECGLLVGCCSLDVAPDVFAAVNAGGLVYDGRLVVDASFRTTDPAIYAAGRHTKFSQVHRHAVASRGGGPTALYHERFNSVELGRHLALCVLDDVDPTTANDPVPSVTSVDRSDLLPQFARPRTLSAKLPGGLFYARSTLPQVPNDAKALPTGMLGSIDAPDDDAAPPPADAVYGSVRSLRDLAAARDKYSVFKVDSHGELCEIVYLGTELVEPRNLAVLVGVHEAYLCSAWVSYERGVVDDWISFFRSDWCAALQHDRFPDLQKQIHDLLEQDQGARDVVTMLLTELDADKDDATIRQLRSEAVGDAGDRLDPNTKQAIQTAVLSYLRKNRVLLPRFQLPERPAAEPNK